MTFWCICEESDIRRILEREGDIVRALSAASETVDRAATASLREAAAVCSRASRAETIRERPLLKRKRREGLKTSDIRPLFAHCQCPVKLRSGWGYNGARLNVKPERSDWEAS